MNVEVDKTSWSNTRIQYGELCSSYHVFELCLVRDDIAKGLASSIGLWKRSVLVVNFHPKIDLTFPMLWGVTQPTFYGATGRMYRLVLSIFEE